METTTHYIVTGIRPTGEVLFLCDHYTQGTRMVPNAQSRASRYTTHEDAAISAFHVKHQYKGLHVAVEPITLPVEDAVHDHAMTQAFGWHGQG